MLNPTTQTFPRHARPSGTEYAAALEIQRRRSRVDWDGIAIAAVMALLLVAAGLYCT